MNDQHLEPLLIDVCAELAATTPDLSLADRIDTASREIQRMTGLRPRRLIVRAALLSRSAQYLLGGALLPATSGEAEHFVEQARGGFRQLGTHAEPHTILVVGPYMVELAHSAAWNDRGVYVRPFVTTLPHSTQWLAGGLPFGVAATYSCDVDVAAATQLSLVNRQVGSKAQADAGRMYPPRAS